MGGVVYGDGKSTELFNYRSSNVVDGERVDREGLTIVGEREGMATKRRQRGTGAEEKRARVVRARSRHRRENGGQILEGAKMVCGSPKRYGDCSHAGKGHGAAPQHRSALFSSQANGVDAGTVLSRNL